MLRFGISAAVLSAFLLKQVDVLWVMQENKGVCFSRTQGTVPQPRIMHSSSVTTRNLAIANRSRSTSYNNIYNFFRTYMQPVKNNNNNNKIRRRKR